MYAFKLVKACFLDTEDSLLLILKMPAEDIITSIRDGRGGMRSDSAGGEKKGGSRSLIDIQGKEEKSFLPSPISPSPLEYRAYCHHPFPFLLLLLRVISGRSKEPPASTVQ